MAVTLAVQNETAIKRTSSLCPVCRVQIDAEVFERDGRVYLRKVCGEHGAFTVLINSDKRFYYKSVGAGGGCCGGGSCGPVVEKKTPGHDPGLIERASTCIALIEIVESCNLRCPTCYADSPYWSKDEVKALTVEEFWLRLEAVISRKGPVDILQLSGGEPTIHPRFFELLEGVLKEKRIGYTLLNTNGVLLARDEEFMKRLGELHRRYRRFEVYLQYDGPQEAEQVALRGGDFRRVREEAIERCEEVGIPCTLAMTVTEANAGYMGESVRFGLGRRGVRGITLQPMFTSGRTEVGRGGLVQLSVVKRLNVADIVLGLIEQSEGLLCERDFTPLPCGDPNCHTIGYVLRRGGGYLPVSKVVDFSRLQGFLKDRVNFNIEDLARCGCESEPLGRLLKEMEIGPDDVFRIFIKPFMDVWTYEQDRIDRCCVHVVGEGGKLESFCRHYAMKG